MPKHHDAILKQLREFGLAYPGVHFKSPWPGHMDLAVKDKTFAYLSLPGEPLGVGCKLPRSSAVALMLPFCTPMAYGLGKSGWVSASFADHEPDVDMLKAWIDESYRAQAPKKLIDAIGTSAPAVAKKKPAAKRSSTAKKKPAAKRSSTAKKSSTAKRSSTAKKRTKH